MGTTLSYHFLDEEFIFNIGLGIWLLPNAPFLRRPLFDIELGIWLLPDALLLPPPITPSALFLSIYCGWCGGLVWLCPSPPTHRVATAADPFFLRDVRDLTHFPGSDQNGCASGHASTHARLGVLPAPRRRLPGSLSRRLRPSHVAPGTLPPRLPPASTPTRRVALGVAFH